jgi:hypothetical protein
MNTNILVIQSHDLETHFESNTSKEISFDIESFLGDFNAESNSLLNIVKEPYVPQQGDKIYFLPQVSVPRVKFKNVSVEYGIKTVRDPNVANVFFGCSRSIHSMTNNAWHYRAQVKDFLEFIKVIDYRLDAHTRDVIETALEFYEKDHIGVSWNIMNCMVATVPDAKVSRHSQRLVYIDDNYKEEFSRLQSLKIYDESSVIDILNGEEATVIDEAMYEHLREMFNSSDKDNHVLAMEIMANSKYTESLIYLELLFHFHASRMMDSNTKSHVNFKSLVSYLNKELRYLYTDLDGVVDSLIRKDQFTPDKMEIVMNHLNGIITQTGDSKHFTVKTITIHPDFIAQLGTNFTYQVQDDYISPEVPVEMEEEEERVSAPEIETIVDEQDLLEEAIARVERAENKAVLVELEEQIQASEPVSNNNQITTNESNDLDWF